MMTLNDFMNRLDLYGADLSRWPVADVKPALGMIADNRMAKDAFAATEAMETLLRFADPALPLAIDTDGLAEKVMARIADNPVSLQPRAEISFFRSIRDYMAPAFGGLMAMAVVGFIVGMPAIAHLQDDPFMQAARQVVTEDTDLYTGELFSS